MATHSFAILTIACILASSEAGVHWGYHGEHAYSEWGKHFEGCNGKKQSPINIVTADTVVDPSLPIVEGSIFSKPPTRLRVLNNGHSIVMEFEKGGYEIDIPALLPFRARMEQAHFHWGEGKKVPGSEHTINGRRYFGELHAVHYNIKYGSLSEAADKPDGLAVFSWLISAHDTKRNPGMQHVLNVARKVAEHEGDGKLVRPFSLESILPENMDVYYRYKGSLTTPPCYESVTWTVFKQPILISPTQAKFLATKFYEGQYEEEFKGHVEDNGHDKTESGETLIQDNFRPVQPLNGRIVTRPPPQRIR